MATQDYYETLQVHPKADTAAIEAAYRRICELYDPARLGGAAEDLVALARAKREAADQAFAVLSDPERRAAYDTEAASRGSSADDRGLAAEDVAPPSEGDELKTRDSRLTTQDAALDYRPLVPARREERPRGFEDQPKNVPGRDARSPLAAPGIAVLLVAAAVVLPALVVSLVLTGGGVTPPAVATPTPSPEDQFEALITQARAAAEQNPTDARAWIDLGNLLYDSAQIIREQAPDSIMYQQRLPRWLEAIEAYDRALELDPSNAAVLADKGASACFYGTGTGETLYVEQGTTDTARARELNPDDPRVLLSHGYCLVSARPPQTEEAVAGWQRLLEIVPADSPLAGQAEQLIEQYSEQ
ncbi:MAG: hypothetical protein RLZZ387_2065 [Chloroflexota bacterium]|jgi:cytochrome c-type biogenesis protein CcmH/NrfG